MNFIQNSLEPVGLREFLFVPEAKSQNHFREMVCSIYNYILFDYNMSILDKKNDWKVILEIK